MPRSRQSLDISAEQRSRAGRRGVASLRANRESGIPGHPATSGRAYTESEEAFIVAVQRFKDNHGILFPSLGQLHHILVVQLGYTRPGSPPQPE